MKVDIRNEDEMALSEHIEEFGQRIAFCIIAILWTTVICFMKIKKIVEILPTFFANFDAS